MNARRAIPAVEKLLQALGKTDLPRPAVVAVVRRELAALRAADAFPPFATVLATVRTRLDQLRCSRLQGVINGTGVILHTNLGRAPMGLAVTDVLTTVASGYSNLELDLTTGERGGRAGYLEHNLAVLTGAQAATVVNNCAAALVLMLRHFTAGARKEVLLSRGELIQIGGGFRIPEVLESSGAKLREVGTTNQTRVDDYARAIGRDTALILRVHRSNFFMGGFVASPAPEALAALARRKRLPLIEDLGSGAVFDTQAYGVDHEPTPAEVLKTGVDLVCFSGDKLLGGPQAGIIAGKRRRVALLKREPLFRALRCDKLVLGVLQATVDAHLEGRGDADAIEARIPMLALLKASCGELRGRAERVVRALAALAIEASVGVGQGQVGGGTLPRVVVPSVTLDLRPQGVALAELAGRLRAGRPPVIGYVSGGRFKIDLRTVFPRQEEDLIRGIHQAMQARPGGEV